MLTHQQMTDVMTALVATGGPWDIADIWLGVFTAINDAGPNTVLADLTFPDGDPGDRQAGTAWGTAYWEADGRHVVQMAAKLFRPANDTEATTIIGWYFADDA